MRPARMMNLAWLRRRNRRSSRPDVASPFDRPRQRAFRGEDDEPRERRGPRAGSRPRLEPLDDRHYGPLVEMGKTLRIQALRGHRAAVIQLQPGLFLVSSVTNEAVRGEFSGVVATAMMSAASRAAADPQGAQQSAQAMQQGLQAMGSGVATTARWLFNLPPPAQAAHAVQPVAVQTVPVHPVPVQGMQALPLPPPPPPQLMLGGPLSYAPPPVLMLCAHHIPRHQCGYCAWLPG